MQLIVLDTKNQNQNIHGSVEKFHAEGVILHSDDTLQITEETNVVTGEAYKVLDIKGHLLADKLRGRSDARLKSNVENITNSLDIVRSLCGKMYNFKNETCKSYGLIAQEAIHVVPDMVHKDEDGYLNISYLELLPILIESIKELDVKINNL